MTLANVVEPLLVEEEGALVMRGEFVHLGHGQRIDGAGFHTVPAEHTLRDVDVKLCRVPLQGAGWVLRTDHLNTTGRTGGLTEIAAHAAFAPIVIAQQR